MGYNDQFSNNKKAADDFEDLCRSIDRTVTLISKAIGQGLDEASEAIGQALHDAKENNSSKQKKCNSPLPHSSQQPNTPVVTFSNNPNRNTALARRYKSSFGLNASGVVMTALGAICTVTFGVSALVAFLSPFIPFIFGMLSTTFVAGGAVCTVLTALSVWLMVAGIKRLTLSSRFNSFKRILGSRDTCTFSEISAQLHQSKKRTIADARKMIKFGLFPQGHIDDECTTFMTTDESYRLYRQTKQEYQRKLEEKKTAELAKKQAREKALANNEMTPEAITFIDTGNNYLLRMRELDNSIDDAAVSAKIVAIEDVLRRMVKRVENEPSTVVMLDKLMDYYLPTTIKLLEAYDGLEKELVQGNNISQSRQEIERTLDVLCNAYEKLLDETYRDISMDVSADITVLTAVLAQDGLTEDPFGKASSRTSGAHARNASQKDNNAPTS